MNRVKFRRICMESSEHNWANISETIYPTMLVFGKKASWMCFFQNILTNPIISQIQFFMTSHFSTLLLSVKLNFSYIIYDLTRSLNWVNVCASSSSESYKFYSEFFLSYSVRTIFIFMFQFSCFS